MTVMLKVKQKKLSLIAKFEKQELATNLSKGYGIGLQNVCDTKSTANLSRLTLQVIAINVAVLFKQGMKMPLNKE